MDNVPRSRYHWAMKHAALSSFALAFVAVGAFIPAACSSSVDYPSGTNGTGTSGSSSSSSGAIDPFQGCLDTCHKLETLSCTLGGDCNTQCNEQIAAIPTECSAQVAAYYSCAVNNITTCEPLLACADFEMAVGECKAKFGCSSDSTCFGGMGMNGEFSCGCDATCKGIGFSTNCTTPPASSFTSCDCLMGGKLLGTCQQADANACGVQESCCNAMFFKL